MSTETLRRRIRSGAFPNAQLADDGWRIPVRDLIDAGLPPVSPRHVAASTADADSTSSATGEAAELLRQRDAQIALLTQLVASQALHITDLRRQLNLEQGDAS